MIFLLYLHNVIRVFPMLATNKLIDTSSSYRRRKPPYQIQEHLLTLPVISTLEVSNTVSEVQVRAHLLRIELWELF